AAEPPRRHGGCRCPGGRVGHRGAGSGARAMSQRMDHAAAHERIEDLLFEPARLADLQASTEPEDVALREHLAGCAACAADLGSWRRLQVAVDRALPADATPKARARAVEPIAAPTSLRDNVLAAIRDTDAIGHTDAIG